MTIDDQAKALEASYGTFCRVTAQPWRRAEDRQEVLQQLKQALAAATHTLSLPPTGQSVHGRSKLILWSEMARGTLKEQGVE